MTGEGKRKKMDRGNYLDLVFDVHVVEGVRGSWKSKTKTGKKILDILNRLKRRTNRLTERRVSADEKGKRDTQGGEEQ